MSEAWNRSLDSPTLDELESLKPFAQNRAQLRNVEALLEHRTHAAAAESLGIARQTLSQSVLRLKRHAIKRGWSPEHDMTEATPEGFSVKGVSSYYRARKNEETGEYEKELRGQWVKSYPLQDERDQLFIEAVQDCFSDGEMRIPEIEQRVSVETDDLLTVYPMGDPHLGMYAWAEECGDDFDLDTAERNLVEATRRLAASVPATRKALIVNLGDFFHSDTMDNRTARSGHALDVDTRWPKVLRVGIRAMRACIEAALQRHEQVHVINEIGNHDDHTSQALTVALDLAYENNPRVTFDMSPMRFHYYRFYDVFIGVTHGDTVKPDKLNGVMSTDNPQEWGETKFRYWYTGHIHNRKVFDLPGVEVESFRTLAAKDFYTASHGYRSGRDMYAIVHHKNYGEIERHRKDILMIQE